MRVSVQKINDLRALVIARVLAGAAGLALLGNNSAVDRGEDGVKTRTAAMTARVAPADSKLQVELK